ncbi:MAG: hypothetical protein CBB68_05480 [Rhodospirillaceae bacterium TMED8]|nr:N-acetylmuramoyl-L-alanine amidase [Magnetovibrio sp.]OUT51472.1 MAG: hypothetical protein CBB68_05480 [Rhodospirillaceae bacterium TMED8]
MAATSIITDIRIGTQENTTRFVFEFTKGMAVNIFTLANPYRIVIDMPEVGWRLPPKPLPSASGVYKRLRYGLYQPGHSRVVLDLKGPVRVANSALIAPNGAYGHRLVLELVPSDHDSFLAKIKNRGVPTVSPSGVSSAERNLMGALESKFQLPGQSHKKKQARATLTPPRFQPAPRKPALRQLGAKYTVMLDPGHGGVDPGTIGVSGLYEKHVTLAMAKAVKLELDKSGRYKVILTRSRDIFIRLRDRINRARETKTDLFISLHADSIKNREISGPSVYTLSERASDKEAGQLAERENKADLIAGIDLTNENADVTGILIDLAQRETMNQSARFAGLLVGQLKRRTTVLRNTHRFAGFAVLKAPDVPSVLLELGFLSNPSDERALRDKRYRRKLAVAVASAVNNYFNRIEQAKGR